MAYVWCYVMVGPNRSGEVLAGITAVVRSSIELAFSIPRIFKGDSATETKAAQLADAAGQPAALLALHEEQVVPEVQPGRFADAVLRRPLAGEGGGCRASTR